MLSLLSCLLFCYYDFETVAVFLVNELFNDFRTLRTCDLVCQGRALCCRLCDRRVNRCRFVSADRWLYLAPEPRSLNRRADSNIWFDGGETAAACFLLQGWDLRAPSVRARTRLCSTLRSSRPVGLCWWGGEQGRGNIYFMMLLFQGIVPQFSEIFFFTFMMSVRCSDWFFSHVWSYSLQPLSLA